MSSCVRGLWLCLSLLVAGAAQAARFDFDSAGGRLPKEVRPFHYRIALDLDPARSSFTGRSDIDLEVRQPVDAIVLNAHRLKPIAAQLIDAKGASRPLTVVDIPERRQWRLATQPAAPLAAGRWRLVIDYEGSVQRSGQGLYRVDYQAQGQAAQMLATQLEPGHARELFPGFDEPAFRASFEITASAPAPYDIVSNMPAAADSVQAGRRTVRFAPTPSMATYLVAVAVGEFDALEGEQDGVKLRILTARGKRDSAAYAMSATKQLLVYYRDYFGLPYALPKLDQLAVPGVRGGAMEDWGLISYNEGTLLFDPQRSSPRTQQTVFGIVAHEIAHQWFGNLVTAAWWDDIWLNEAFATWMAAKASEHFNPQWELRARARRDKESGMRRDAGAATRPIAIPVETEDAVFGVFDELTYEKGGAVLSMFESAMGPDTFRDGLRRYMLAHAYGNATASDLWFHFSQAAGRDISSQIGGWIEQPGFPVVDVGASCVAGRTELSLSQSRFTTRATGAAPTTWQVPVGLSSGRETRSLVLGQEPVKLVLPGCEPVIVNAGDAGYYRVRYDAEASARLRAATATLTSIDRIAITADMAALAASGRLRLADYLEWIAAPAPRSASEWQAILSQLEAFDQALAGTPAQAALRRWGRERFAPELARLGWEPGRDEEQPTLRLRNQLIDLLGRFDDAPTIERARALHASGAVPPSIVAGVVNAVARHANAAQLDALLAERKAARGQEEVYRLGHALSLVRDPVLAERVLALTLSEEWEPPSAAWLAGQVGPGSGNTELGWSFMRQNFSAISAKASDWGRLWLLPSAADGFNDAARADELIAAQEAALGEPGRDAARQVAERIRERAELRAREGHRLAAEMASRKLGVTPQ
ncbi:MAG: M1 family metallopeptidase [Burkholderiaceae bacterium]